MQKLYRYEDGYNGEMGFSPPKLLEFKIVKETEKGWWISEIGWLKTYLHDKKWTSKTALRRYVHETKEEALKAYIKRKEKQSMILEHRKLKTKAMLDMALLMESGKEIKTNYFGILTETF